MIKEKKQFIKAAERRMKLKKAVKEQPTKEESSATMAINNIEKTGAVTLSENSSRTKKIISNRYVKYKKNKLEQHKCANLKIKDLKIKTKSTVNSTANVQINSKMMKIGYIKPKYQKTRVITEKLEQTAKSVVYLIKQTLVFSKLVVSNLIAICSVGIGFILLILLVLFISVFAVFGDTSSADTGTLSINDKVISYTPVMMEYAQEYNIEEYIYLIQAIMMVESAGEGSDPMQSSLFENNTSYPKVENGIEDSEYSIQIGIEYIAQCITLAKVEGIDDIEEISLVVQAYKYDVEYITWALINFDGYSRANAIVYAEDIQVYTGSYSNDNYVDNVLQYYQTEKKDIVSIAQSQIGNVGGELYWSWYGYDNRVEWCACFVSWCANEASMLFIDIPKFSSVVEGIEWFKEKGTWEDGDYIPNAGDIIFFDWGHDGIADHVGIVEKVENGIIYTIEGNSVGDECRRLEYKINSDEIVGYGVNNQFI